MDFFFTLFRIACNLKQWLVLRSFHLTCLGKGTETTESKITGKGKKLNATFERETCWNYSAQITTECGLKLHHIKVKPGHIIVKAKCEVMREATEA